MNLVLHQFRKDVRQFRYYLAVWFGLLLLDLAVNLGWAGQVVYSPDRGFDHGANTWTAMLPRALWVLAAILPSVVVLTDSPTNHEGFLATRPLPKRVLYLAKLLFILALIVAPWALSETVHLAWLGLPGWVVGRATFERVLFMLPVALGFSAYAALWPTIGRWGRSLAIITGGYVVVGITVSLLEQYFQWDLFGHSKAPGVVGAYAFALALLGFAAWHARGHRGVLVRWGGLILITWASQAAVSWLWRWDTFALRPVDSAVAGSVVAGSGWEIPARSLWLQKVQETDGAAQPHFDIVLTPKIQPPPPHDVVEWSGTAVKLAREDGSEIHGGAVYPGGVFNVNNYWNMNYQPSDFAAWATEFPPGVLFRQNNYYGSGEPGSVSFHRFDLPAGGAELTEPLTVQAGLEARVFQWHKIADLPLTPGATSTDEFGSWKFIAAQPKPQPYVLAGLYLQRRQIELATADNSRCSDAQNGPLSRMSVMVYDPLRQVVWLPDSFAFNSVTRSTHTALAQYFIQLEFNSHKVFSPAEIARCRLVVIEKTWVGSVPETWSSPAFTIDEKLAVPPGGAGRVANNNPLPRPEFNHRIAALKVPAPDASRRDVSLYLLDFFRLVEAERFSPGDNYPYIRQLATFVPAHLDLLLDGLPVMDGASRDAVISAIKLGATEAQKPAIIAALQKEPDLAEVLFARGWVDDARPEILHLAQTDSRRGLPPSALRAIVWLQDPQTYPRLLAEFEGNPTLAADDLLRTVPGLEPELDRIVVRRWQNDSLMLRQNNGWAMFDETFRLALRHGQTSALQRAYLVLNDPDFDQMNLSYALADAFTGAVQMPGVKASDRRNNQKVLAWMRQHRAEDFVYNPALRKFVLQSSLAAASTTGNP
ncbi:MAG: hypothetical protein P4N60_14675 [Verrucomicrobiae bacterium]|nr:hypothetical protein [Verrucomicrobiae bacterium]